MVPQGSFFGLVGPNGAGKTTTLSMATGLLRPDAGTAWVHGVDVWAEPARAKAMIGNLADDACTPSHTRRIFDAIGHPDKEMHEIPGANHYYAGADQRDKLRAAVDICTEWLQRRGLSA